MSSSEPGTDDTIAAQTRAGEVSPGGSEPQELERGTIVGRYMVLAKLGAGGMGVVYTAYDPELDRRVALKLLVPRVDAGAGSAGRARLLREVQALAKLSHPNVVAVHDVGTYGEGRLGGDGAGGRRDPRDLGRASAALAGDSSGIDGDGPRRRGGPQRAVRASRSQAEITDHLLTPPNTPACRDRDNGPVCPPKGE